MNKTICWRCDGTGKIGRAYHKQECPVCNGGVMKKYELILSFNGGFLRFEFITDKGEKTAVDAGKELAKKLDAEYLYNVLKS